MQRAAVITESRNAFSFWQGVITFAISAAGALLVVGIAWGMLSMRVANVEAKQVEQSQQNANVEQRLERIQERMVDKDLFNETRQDVKELLKRK
jgi:uncharacterized membrane-anchored protein YhcB (DUF1043 family)